MKQGQDHLRCEICDLKFTQKIDFTQHVEEHKNEKIRDEEMKNKETLTEKQHRNTYCRETIWKKYNHYYII